MNTRFTYVKCFLVNRIEHFEAVVGRCFLISIYLNNSTVSSVLLCYVYIELCASPDREL